MSKNEKVLIIGLDGATFEFIKPLSKLGELPNIGKLMKQGSWGNLMSVPSMFSPAARSSFPHGGL